MKSRTACKSAPETTAADVFNLHSFSTVSQFLVDACPSRNPSYRGDEASIHAATVLFYLPKRPPLNQVPFPFLGVGRAFLERRCRDVEGFLVGEIDSFPSSVLAPLHDFDSPPIITCAF